MFHRCGRAPALWALLALGQLACNSASPRGIAKSAFDAGTGLSTPAPGDPTEAPDPCRADRDADGIADRREGSDDPDHDGIPNQDDPDSDGDSILDRDETSSENPCAPSDSDGDGTPDFLDPDSDNDGLSDREEVAMGTDPRNTDTDGDGVSDLAEKAAGTDPGDRDSTIGPQDYFVVLPYQEPPITRPLRFGSAITRADVFFLVDTTGSMRGERDNLIQGLLDVIIPGIQAEVPDVHFGAGGFDDYPVRGYGRGNDLPFYLLKSMAPGHSDAGRWSVPASSTACPDAPASRDVGLIEGAPNGRADILEAIEGLPCHQGGDGPESYVPALYATATGFGLSWPMDGTTGGPVPDQRCPIAPDEPEKRRGYPCFRPKSLPVVLLFGDALSHNGPEGSDAYSFGSPTYADAILGLDRIGARVIGISSNDTNRTQFERIARDTGAVDRDGSPLVFSISGSGDGLDETVVEAVSVLVTSVPQDVSTTVENVSGNPDGFDATRFIKRVTPIDGFRGGAVGPMPGVTYARADDTTFYEVIPGTKLSFEIDFENDTRPPGETTQVFQAIIAVQGNGVARLDERRVYLIVPPQGSRILI